MPTVNAMAVARAHCKIAGCSATTSDGFVVNGIAAECDRLIGFSVLVREGRFVAGRAHRR